MHGKAKKLVLFSFWLFLVIKTNIAYANTLLNQIDFNEKALELNLSSSAEIKLFTLENPPRLVADIYQAKLSQSLIKKITTKNFKDIRYSATAEKLRLVFDLKEALKIGNVDKNNNNKSFNIVAQIIRIEKGKIIENDSSSSREIDFANFIASKVSELDQRKVKPELIVKKSTQDRIVKPIIVIDAGHGGNDPGAIGSYLRSKEKNITLSYAKELYRQLKSANRYKVYLTRDNDKFITLRQRVEIARKKQAHLFISIHANAAENRDVSGFSIYTLSENSSDKQAALLAQKENRADIINGINFSGASQDIVKTMIAMSQRDSMNRSARFAKFSVNSMQNANINILRNAHRFAGFVVLTAPDMISVLVELGYITNYREERNLNSFGYKNKVVKSLVKAIENYFAKYQIKE